MSKNEYTVRTTHRMKLVIPMSGQGSRFQKAGYTDPKPLIRVEGRPIIAHVLDMFPGEDDVIFVCTEEHLATTDMRSILVSLKPKATIISVPAHKKGPVYAVSQAFPYIADDEDVMVSYCDFTQRWDYESFKRDIGTLGVAGAIPSYTGFHPHLLRKNLYAGVIADEHGMLLDIKEKHCFTEKPEDSYHSSGAYYFSSGALVKKYFTELMEADINLNGEYYVSMVYYLLKRDGLPIYVPTVDHFMQWGTPEDLEEYEAWSRQVHTDLSKEKSATDIPSHREELVTIPTYEDELAVAKADDYWLTSLKQAPQ